MSKGKGFSLSWILFLSMIMVFLTMIIIFLTKILVKKKRICYNDFIQGRIINKEFMMQLRNRLKELRARDGLNQTELAKLAGVSRQTISLIERGEYTPSIVIALKIAHIFNENVENVFRLVEEAE